MHWQIEFKSQLHSVSKENYFQRGSSVQFIEHMKHKDKWVFKMHTM